MAGKGAVVAGANLGMLSKIGLGSALGFRNDLRAIIGAKSPIGASFHILGEIGESANAGDKAEASTIWMIDRGKCVRRIPGPAWN